MKSKEKEKREPGVHTKANYTEISHFKRFIMKACLSTF